MSANHTPGPLSVRFSDKWPFDIETVNKSGEVVFRVRMPCHSSADKTLQSTIDCAHFNPSEREQCSAINRRTIADANLRAAAPDLLEALMGFMNIYFPVGTPDTSISAKARAAIAKATGEQQ